MAENANKKLQFGAITLTPHKILISLTIKGESWTANTEETPNTIKTKIISYRRLSVSIAASRRSI